jgi:hypothetical protein
MEGVTFADVNRDGELDVVAIVTARGRSAEFRRVLMGSFAGRLLPELSARAEALGAVSLKKIVQALTPLPFAGASVSCRPFPHPWAVSVDKKWVFSPESETPIVSLWTGAPSPKVGPRLAQSLRRIQRDCHWETSETSRFGWETCKDVVLELKYAFTGDRHGSPDVIFPDVWTRSTLVTHASPNWSAC